MSSSSSDSFFIVDDHDTSSINYETSSLWFPATVNSNQAIGGTLTSGLAGAKATFNFSGTAIAVMGVVGSAPGVSPPVVQFLLDGQTVQTTTAPNNGSKDLSFPFLVIDSVRGGQHELEIDVLAATQEYPFALDAIIYEPMSGATPTASQSVITTSLPASTGFVESASSKSSSTPVGAIVGGVIGGLAVLVAAFIAIWFFYFQRHRRNGKPYFYASSAKPGDLLEHEVKPEPYETRTESVTHSSTLGHGSQYGSPPSAYMGPSSYNAYLPFANAPSEAPANNYSPGSSVGPSQPPSTYLFNAQPVTASPNQPRSKAAEAGLLRVPRNATYHADSGIRFDENGQAQASSSSANVLATNDLADVPPSYSAS